MIAWCAKSNNTTVTGPQEAGETEAHLWDYQREILKASDKSKDALVSLTRLYMFASNRPVEAYKWDEIGAENGDVVSQANLASVLAGNGLLPYRKNPMRGWYWYDVLVKAGVGGAKKSMELHFSESEISRYEAEQQQPLVLPQRLGLADITSLQDRAWLGSTEAALKLYEFHTEYRSQFEERLYWARIGAQNGGNRAQVLVAKLLLSSTDYDSRIRAWFWLNRAVNSGNSEARDLLAKEFQKAP